MKYNLKYYMCHHTLMFALSLPRFCVVPSNAQTVNSAKDRIMRWRGVFVFVGTMSWADYAWLTTLKTPSKTISSINLKLNPETRNAHV